MKKLLTTLCAASGLALCMPALAGEAEDCHFHGRKAAAQETVVGCATQQRRVLAASGKIDKSWLAISATAIEQVEGQRGKEWKLSFKDPAATDKARETLYMFFTAQGNFIAANFSGK